MFHITYKIFMCNNRSTASQINKVLSVFGFHSVLLGDDHFWDIASSWGRVTCKCWIRLMCTWRIHQNNGKWRYAHCVDTKNGNISFFFAECLPLLLKLRNYTVELTPDSTYYFTVHIKHWAEEKKTILSFVYTYEINSTSIDYNQEVWVVFGRAQYRNIIYTTMQFGYPCWYTLYSYECWFVLLWICSGNYFQCHTLFQKTLNIKKKLYFCIKMANSTLLTYNSSDSIANYISCILPSWP